MKKDKNPDTLAVIDNYNFLTTTGYPTKIVVIYSLSPSLPIVLTFLYIQNIGSKNGMISSKFTVVFLNG